MIALCLIVVAGMTGAEQPLAVVTVETGQVSFAPARTGDNLQLTVSGPQGIHVQKVCEPGVMASVSAGDLGGKQLADGVYTYQLRPQLTITPELREALLAARERGDDVVLAELPGADQLPAKIQVQRGAFSVVNGSLSETGTKDQVITENLIVDGSLCVGTDCAAGLAFDYDTIVLKENSLRVLFDDTSTSSSSYPANDWRLVINDTNSGGDSYLGIQDVTGGSIPFRIEAGAPTDALTVTSSGDIEIGGKENPRLTFVYSSTDAPWSVWNEQGVLWILNDFLLRPGLVLNSNNGVVSTWDSLRIEPTDISTETTAELEIIRQGAARIRLEDKRVPDNAWVLQNWYGELGITMAGTGNQELSLDGNGNMEILGSLRTSSIGIGLNPGAAPSAELEIMKEGKTRIRLSDTSDGGASWVLRNNSGNLDFTKAGTAKEELSLDGFGNMEILGSLKTSSIGIGLPTGAAPAAELEIKTSGAARISLEDTTGSGKPWIIENQDDKLGLNWGTTGSPEMLSLDRYGTMELQGEQITCGDQIIYGKVGIGLPWGTWPETELDIRNQWGGGVRIRFHDAGTIWSIRCQQDEFLITNWDTGLVREFRLFAGGDLRITGTLTTGSGATYPDYVFEPDYPLMPLDDLEQFIEENRRLPNIPPAAEIAEKGLNVSATQIKLLEKVEELTLYTIEQQHTIEQLIRSNAEQQKVIEQLMARLAALEHEARQD
jgi:hypothetical protein